MSKFYDKLDSGKYIKEKCSKIREIGNACGRSDL